MTMYKLQHNKCGPRFDTFPFCNSGEGVENVKILQTDEQTEKQTDKI